MDQEIRKATDESISVLFALKEKYGNNDQFKTNCLDYIHTQILSKFPNITANPQNVIQFYRSLLQELRAVDNETYIQIHKGVAYFYIGWLSFLLKHYDQAIFYLDAALAEDKVTHKKNDIWATSGAANFFKLTSVYTDKYSKFTTEKLFNAVLSIFDEFNSATGSNISIENYRECFAEKILIEDNTAIITTLYSFILEHKDISEMIQLRSHFGGTIEPMIIHLFKGAVIFETLLKINNKSSEEHEYRQLSGIFSDKNSPFLNKYPEFKLHGGNVESLSGIISHLRNAEYENQLSSAFNTAYKIRNSTAHKLSWDDVFDNEENYEILYIQLIRAIVFIIQREYIN